MTAPSSSSSGGGGSGGVYHVQENGAPFQHCTKIPNDPPSSPEQFLQNFRDNFEMNVLEAHGNDLVLEFKNVDVSFVNALRRILLAEVPSIAIETVYMWDNTSLLHDEVLSHRLGLLPLRADARWLEKFQGEPLEDNVLVFNFNATCPAGAASGPPSSSRLNREQRDKRADAVQEALRTGASGDAPVVDDHGELTAAAIEQAYGPDAVLEKDGEKTKKKKREDQPPGPAQLEYPADRPFTHHVYSNTLTWLPQGEQADIFPYPPAPLLPDILVAKLRPGQCIQLEAHAVRGIGHDHAKFSPVATASYRLAPHIELMHAVYDDDAEQLCYRYEPGVFDLVPTTPDDDPAGTRVKAVVVNALAGTMSRNYLRHPELARCVRMTRDPRHFIVSIESVGTMAPGVLLAEALRVLMGKCERVADLAEMSKMQQHDGGGGAATAH